MFAQLLTAGIIMVAPLPDRWIELGNTPLGKYEVNIASVKADKVQNTVQFDMRYTFPKPIGKTKYIIQNQLLLCKEDILIDMTEIAYDEKDKKVDAGTTAVVYHNPHNDSIVSKLLQYSCGDSAKQADPIPQEFPSIQNMGRGKRYTT